jgi:hypothetical protein
MYFLSSLAFVYLNFLYKSTTYTKRLFTFRKSKNGSSINTQSIAFEQEKKGLKTGMLIIAKYRNGLVTLLKKYTDVFAWSYADMPRLDTDIVVHKLPLIDKYKLVKHKLRRIRLDILIKLRRIRLDILIKLKEKVKKKWDARFQELVKYL